MSTRTPKYVPKQSIEWIVARLHVGTSDAEVAADIRRRFERTLPPMRPIRSSMERKIEACITYALKCHHDNGALYTRVMRGDL